MKKTTGILTALMLAVTSSLTATAMSAPADACDIREELAIQPTLKVTGGSVELTLPGDEARQVLVYSLTGQLVKTVTVYPGVTTIELSPGYYIVKCDRLSQRVIVR